MKHSDAFQIKLLDECRVRGISVRKIQRTTMWVAEYHGHCEYLIGGYTSLIPYQVGLMLSDPEYISAILRKSHVPVNLHGTSKDTILSVTYTKTGYLSVVLHTLSLMMSLNTDAVRQADTLSDITVSSKTKILPIANQILAALAGNSFVSFDISIPRYSVRSVYHFPEFQFGCDMHKGDGLLPLNHVFVDMLFPESIMSVNDLRSVRKIP